MFYAKMSMFFTCNVMVNKGCAQSYRTENVVAWKVTNGT